jgi:hypothetical protein
MVIPADVPASVSEEMRALALRAYRALRCDGLARADFFYDAAGRGLMFNEINTLPGFTPFSMFPSLWAATGLPYTELIDELVRLAIARHQPPGAPPPPALSRNEATPGGGGPCQLGTGGGRRHQPSVPGTSSESTRSASSARRRERSQARSAGSPRSARTSASVAMPTTWAP